MIKLLLVEDDPTLSYIIQSGFHKDVFVAKLRKLLEDDPLVSIKTIRGVGLMLVDN